MVGLVIEGVTGSGKTTVLKHLRHYLHLVPQEAHLILTQSYTQRMVEHLGQNKRPEDVVRLLKSLLSPLETIHGLFEASVFSTHPRRAMVEFAYILETFHLNNLIEADYPYDDSFRAIDRRLARIGARMVVLSIPEGSVRERAIESTRRYRSGKWLAYQKAFGLTDAELEEKYRRQQRRLLKMASEGSIPFTVIGTGEGNWEQISRAVFSYWQAGSGK